MAKFRSREIVEAVRWTGTEIEPSHPDWLPKISATVDTEEEALFVPHGTLWRQGDRLFMDGGGVGSIFASPGDFIVLLKRGFSIVKQYDFAVRYEALESANG